MKTEAISSACTEVEETKNGSFIIKKCKGVSDKMLKLDKIEEICKEEIEITRVQLATSLECGYEWQNEKTMDYNVFRFSNPLFYNAKKQIENAENDFRELYIRILKHLFSEKESDYDLFDFSKDKSLSTPILFAVSSEKHEKTAFCFKTKIEGENWIELKKDFGFINLNIIFFSAEYSFNFRKRYEEDGLPNKIYIGKELFVLFDEFFGKGASEIVRSLFVNFVKEIRGRIGIIAIDSTSEVKSYNLKKRIRNYIQHTDFMKQGFWKITETKDYTGTNSYRINLIESDKLGISEENKDRIKKQFVDNKYYEIMLGNSDFANSLMTSEWLYYSFKNKVVSTTEKFDFTPVICGYLKSMEQLIYLLMRCLVDKGYYAQAAYRKDLSDFLEKNNIPSKDRHIKGKTYYDIELTEKWLKHVDTQLGALVVFLNQPSSKLKVLKTNYHDICKILNDFRDECRNGYFHTDNVYNWEIVEKVRENAYLLYFLILGDCNNISLENSILDVSLPSKYETFCNKIGPFFSGFNRIYMIDKGEEKEIDIDVDEETVYENGGRIYKRILVTTIERNDELDEIGFLSEPFYFTEDNMPDEIYILNSNTREKTVIWKK